MLAISLKTILEQAAADEHGEKRLAGNIADFEALLESDNLRRLESSVDGFAYLAFHPAVDHAVRRYVEEGTLASDSGRRILSLFTLGQPATWPQVVTEQSFGSWLQMDDAVHPAYAMIEWLFAPTAPPPLPGIALFDSVTEATDVIYVPATSASDAAAVRSLFRQVFSFAGAALEKGDFADRLGARLQRDRIAYVRTGRKSMRELFIRGSQSAADNVSELVAVAGLAV